MANPWRRFRSWQLIPPFPAGKLVNFTEPASRNLLWSNLRLRTEVAEHGRKLFPGTVAQRNRLLNEFRSYVRIAKAYDDAGGQVDGSAASLLHYYAAMNLAKAELLTTTPQAIIGKRSYHGLSFNPQGARTAAGDTLTVQTACSPCCMKSVQGHQ